MKAQHFAIPQTTARPLFVVPPGHSPPNTLPDLDTESTCVLVRATLPPYKNHLHGLGGRRNDQYLSQTTRSPHHWGVILAGGDGTRLRELTRSMYGDDRPKQFCSLMGECTLLEQTRQRAERTLPPEHILFAVTRTHEKYYRSCLSDITAQTIVQPCNRGTAPAIIYSLLLIARKDPSAIVAILPSDHHFSPENMFTSILNTAMQIAEQRFDSIVLLGAEPKGPETEYGWLQLGEAVQYDTGLFRVRGFREKPSLPVAKALLKEGSLWNTFVIVGQARTILDAASTAVPDLFRALVSGDAHRRTEMLIPESLYRAIPPVDFSAQVLAAVSDRLLALHLANVVWNDLGDPYRVLVTLVERNGDLPDWADLWPKSEQEQLTMSATGAL